MKWTLLGQPKRIYHCSNVHILLFRQCLGLIEEAVSEIVAEKELIEAMRLLANCQVAILPVKGIPCHVCVFVCMSCCFSEAVCE